MYKFSQMHTNARANLDPYEVIAMVVSFLTADTNLHFVITSIASRLQEVFRKKLAILIELVSGTLRVPVSS